MPNHTPPMPVLDRAKYLKILQSEGLHTAISSLHRDMERWEFETFEGREGYRPEVFKFLEEAREFSRELWRVSLGEMPVSASSSSVRF